MLKEFLKTIKILRGSILGWTIALAAYSLLMVFIYPDLAVMDFEILLQNFPDQLLAFFGESINILSSPQGYLDVVFFKTMIVAVGIYAVSAGAKLIAGDEDHGLLDLIASSPISRSGIFWGRVLAYLFSLGLILFSAWICWLLPSQRVGLNLSALELVRPFIPLLGQLVFFGSLALLMSFVLPSSRLASMLSGGLLVGSYLLIGLKNIHPGLADVARLTPLHLYQGGQAVQGLNPDHLIILTELIILCWLLAWWRLLERDLRVSGENDQKTSIFKADIFSKNQLVQRFKQPLVFLSQRILFGVLVLVFITYSSFLGLDMARGESFQEAAVQGVTKTFEYAGDVIHGDLGETSSGSVSLLPKPVEEVVPDVIVRSLGLLAVSLTAAALLGILLGVFIAGKRSGLTLLALLGSIIGVSVPSFFAALLLQLGVIKLTQTTGKALLPVGGFGWDKHLILPAIVLAARPLAQITRVTFVTVEEILSQDYIRTAFSKGLRSSRVTMIHIIRNAAVPVLTTLGLSLRFALSSLPIVEFFFGWQGVGYTLLQSISNRDDYLTIILAMILGMVFILVNILLDGAYLVIDPRLRKNGSTLNLHSRQSLFGRVQNLLQAVKEFLAEKPWRGWFGKAESAAPSPFQELVEKQDEDFEYNDFLEMTKHRARIWVKATLGNPALILGGITVLVLMVLMLFSPQLSPHSPYTTQGMVFEDGEFTVPPFAPDAEYPWGTDPLGRDIMSLIFAGAQQTFTLAFSVVAVRLVIGFVLGAVVGWFAGGWLDRFMLGLAETISAFPNLLLVMVLILGIGIRQGMRPFVIALSFIGWSEIMQYIRSKVIEIKPKLYIESAAAVGARPSRMITKHILPNLIPGLISILSLEMGAVLMLLGELGFIGIFIGGGAFAELEIFGPPYHYSDVPEWGALLSNIRVYARSYPWTALYPAGAFFVAIMGFNFLGEGIRRLIDQVGVAATRLFVNKYTLAAVGVLAAGFFWLRGSTGSTAVFYQQATEFSGYNAMAHLQALTDPMMQGRSLGSDGIDLSAAYIAHQFQAAGLQPAGEAFSYYQTRERSFQKLVQEPVLTLHDSTMQPEYHQDFAEYVGRNRNMGVVTAPVHVLGFGNLMQIGNWFRDFPALQDVDFSGEIVMVFSEREAAMIEEIPKAGLLVVTEDPQQLRQVVTISSRNPYYNPFGSTETRGYLIPQLRISEEVANQLLAGTGYQVNSIRKEIESLKQDQFINLSTAKQVTMGLQGKIVDDEQALNVIGHLPGLKGDKQAQLDNQLIVVLAQYDSPPLMGDEEIADFANDNASGVAVMLELIRTIQETGYQPNRTFLFIAYSGEGQEGGEWVQPDISKFLQTKYGFSTFLNTEAVIEIRAVGAGNGDSLLLSTEGSLRLGELFEACARRMSVPVQRADDQLDLSGLFEDQGHPESSDEAPYVGVYWDEWWETGGTPEDNLDTISIQNLEDAGETISLAAMILGYEMNY